MMLKDCCTEGSAVATSCDIGKAYASKKFLHSCLSYIAVSKITTRRGPPGGWLISRSSRYHASVSLSCACAMTSLC